MKHSLLQGNRKIRLWPNLLALLLIIGSSASYGQIVRFSTSGLAGSEATLNSAAVSTGLATSVLSRGSQTGTAGSGVNTVGTIDSISTIC
jgi:hypothetical protein